MSRYLGEEQRNNNSSNEQIPMAECKTEEIKLCSRVESENNLNGANMPVEGKETHIYNSTHLEPPNDISLIHGEIL